ncbi:uncharacterized protein BO80DRAFT_377333 [Aspergillus ibericus CBS 121593]|uniref:Uncharacterized protein n=1 Tax=Aspergillus ibericus CBS 121593 TaxID=1448316 RepID=A0A395H6Z8_9EURO|nr:hypothetical protein BO80DRAFT_377333 [Aspergillus ibericus CBS 121593]RAL03329.1 hypothetical protein BO80DRAFT_377333 [Aspergillus ibericus CBS 121593]
MFPSSFSFPCFATTMDPSMPEHDYPAASSQATQDAVRDLTSCIQQLRSLINQENERRDPQRIRQLAKQNDPILKALDEEIDSGRPTQVVAWKKVQLMPQQDIDAENEAYMKRYTAFWEEFASTPVDKQVAEDAYELAFDQFPQVYRSLGWHKNDDLLFDAVVLTRYRDTLLAALFAIEPYRLKHLHGPLEQSRAAFEYSRLPRLLLILVRLEARRNDALECRNGSCVDCRYFDADQTLNVLMEVGRSLRLIRLGGVNEMSLEELLHRCYARRIITQPNADDSDLIRYQFHLIYDCLDALDFTTRFREIRDPLSLTFYLQYKTEPIHKIFEMVKSHTSVMDGIEKFKELPLEQSLSPTFSPETFTVQYLQDFGGLNIEWTDCLDDHLKIFTGRHAIRIFAHPTFFYNCQDLHERDYLDPIYRELSDTYALLFRPSSRKGIRQLELGRRKTRFSERHSAQKRVVGKTIDNNSSNASSRVLENFHRCSLPPTIQAAFNIASPSLNIMDTSSFNQHKVTSTPMREIHSCAPYYPEDIEFMINSIFEHELHSDEPFLRYDYFGPRLRRLKSYLDNRQPKTLKQIWCDRRDTRAWWTFWGSAFFLSTILVLSAGILVLQIQLSRFSA